MALGFENHLYKHYSRHFSKPIFIDLHSVFTKQNYEFRHSFPIMTMLLIKYNKPYMYNTYSMI